MRLMGAIDFLLRGKKEPIEIDLSRTAQQMIKKHVWGILFYHSLDLTISGEAKSGYPGIEKIRIEKGNNKKKGIHIWRDWKYVNELIAKTQEKASSALGALMTGEIWIDKNNLEDAVEIAMMMADDTYQFHSPTGVGDENGEIVFRHCLCNKETAKRLMKEMKFPQKKMRKLSKNRQKILAAITEWEEPKA